jgi:serine/threonine protein phosphatase PrpC
MFAATKQIEAGESELQDRADFFWSGPNLILVLADGAGGLSGGAEAAEFVIERLKGQNFSAITNPQQLCAVLASFDREMFERGTFGETTCVVIILLETEIIGVSVGDSGALIFSKDGTKNLTANQIRKPLVGSGRAIPIGFASSQLEGTLIVASDGLLKYASQEKIAATIFASDFNSVTSKLVGLVRYPSGALPDDVSILLVQK